MIAKKDDIRHVEKDEKPDDEIEVVQVKKSHIFSKPSFKVKSKLEVTKRKP